MRLFNFFLLAGVILFNSTALAQSPSVLPSTVPTEITISPESTSIASTSPELTETVPTFNFKTRSIGLTKILRFFTLNKLKRGELTAAIANALLVQAHNQDAAGLPNRATATLTKFEQENAVLQTIVTTINANTANVQVQEFLSNVSSDQAAIYSALKDNNLLGSTELTTKATKIQAKALRDVVKILQKNMPAEEREKKLAKILNEYSRKTAKLQDKIVRKFELIDELNEVENELDINDDDDSLNDDLEGESDELLSEAAEGLDDNELKDLAETIDDESDSKSLVRLEKLLNKVPESAKGGIETAIDAIVATKIKDFQADPTRLSAFLDDRSVSAAEKEKILERIKEKGGSSLKLVVEQEKKKVENDRETTKQKKEKAAEEQRQSDEKRDKDDKKSQEQDKDDDEQESKATAKPTSQSTSSSESVPATSTPKPSTNSTATNTPTPTPTPTPQTEKSEVEIKIKDGGFDKTNYTVKKGSSLTIKFKNEDDTARTLSLSNGKSSSSISDSETTLSAFTIDATITFNATGVSGTGAIYVQ